MIKYRSHQTANSREYQSGCPGAWPQIEELVDDSRKLTAEEVAAGFSLITDEEHSTIRVQHKAAFEAWQASQKTAEDSATNTKRTEAKDAIDALEAVRTSTGDLTVRQLSNFARLNARLWQIVIRNAPEIFER